MKARRRERGFVLLMVLFFALLLTSSTATFLRRATVDAGIVHNREASARAEGLARGGVRLAHALLAEDLRQEIDGGLPAESREDVWARVADVDLAPDPDESLRVHIEDAGARLNLNAVLADDAAASARAEAFLVAFFEKVINEMPGRPEEKLYEPSELARDLVDWVDPDGVRVRGGDEAEPYRLRKPPYGPPNRPLLSVDELRLVAGFDGKLVEALRPYLGIFPLVGGAGINPNTAPPWVLAILYHGVAGDLRLADEDEVRELLEAREEGVICPETVSDDRCVPIHEATHGIRPGDEVFPPIGFRSHVFRIVVEARVGEVERRLEVILDRSQPRAPTRLTWRMR